MLVALQAIQILWPMIESMIKAIQNGTVDAEVTKIPHPLRSEVALAARDVLDK
jgi:hypothetical protein